MPQRTDTDTPRTRRPTRALSALAVAALLASVSAAQAAADPQQKCQKGRYDAAAKYAACQQKAAAKYYGGGGDVKYEKAYRKCRVTYAATWPKLRKKASGTGATCDYPRFADNGDGTVTDRLTGLQWEKTTGDVGLHYYNNFSPWSAFFPGGPADGTVFTSFLAALNSGGCFAGQCDWRLPTIYELQTILLEPCTTSPCIDQTVFGPTVSSYWSSSTLSTNPYDAWVVSFSSGRVDPDSKRDTLHVRAVRAGL